MKYWILALSLAVTAFVFAPSQAEAGNFYLRIGPSNAWGYATGHHQWRSSSPRYSNRCQPRHVVRTCVVNKCRRKQVGYLPCGRRYTYYVTVVTYRDQYSDGTCRTYTRTYRG